MHPPVHRRRHDLVALGAAARGRGRGTRGAPRGSAGCTRQGQRHAQSRAHGPDRRRADDRPRSRDSRGHAGREPQEHRPQRAQGPGARRLRRYRGERLRHVHVQRGQRAGERAWSRRRVGGAQRQGEQLRLGHRRHGDRPLNHRQRLRLPLDGGVGQRAAVARLRRGDRPEPVRGRTEPRGRQPVLDADAAGQEDPARGAGDLRSARRAARCAAGVGDARAAGLRHALPAAEGPVRLRRYRRRRDLAGDRLARQDAQPVSRRGGAHQQRLGQGAGGAAST